MRVPYIFVTKKCAFQSGKMVHASLLLVMLEAVTTDLISPSA
jgi:hypothetical protein